MLDESTVPELLPIQPESTITEQSEQDVSQENDGVKTQINESTREPELMRLDESLAYDSPESLAIYDAETAKIVADFERVVTAAESEYEDAKSGAKEAKEYLEAKEAELRRLIRERAEQRGKPVQPTLFSTPVDPHAEEGLTDSPDTDLPPDDWKPATTTEKDDETWKQVPLSSLSLKPGLLKKLESPVHKDRGPISPIVTLGDLTRYQEPEANGYVKRLIDIKGIGAAAADEIGEACLQFWAERNAAR